MNAKQVEAYNDSFNERHSEGIEQTELGYRYRLINGLMMPPYVTPERFQLSIDTPTRENDCCFCSFPKSGSTWLSRGLVTFGSSRKNSRQGDAPATHALGGELLAVPKIG